MGILGVDDEHNIFFLKKNSLKNNETVLKTQEKLDRTLTELMLCN